MLRLSDGDRVARRLCAAVPGAFRYFLDGFPPGGVPFLTEVSFFDPVFWDAVLDAAVFEATGSDFLAVDFCSAAALAAGFFADDSESCDVAGFGFGVPEDFAAEDFSGTPATAAFFAMVTDGAADVAAAAGGFEAFRFGGD